MICIQLNDLKSCLDDLVLVLYIQGLKDRKVLSLHFCRLKWETAEFELRHRFPFHAALSAPGFSHIFQKNNRKQQYLSSAASGKIMYFSF